MLDFISSFPKWPWRYVNNIYSKKLLESNDVCLLYTSDAADDLLCVDLGGRRIIKKKNKK